MNLTREFHTHEKSLHLDRMKYEQSISNEKIIGMLQKLYKSKWTLTIDKCQMLPLPRFRGNNLRHSVGVVNTQYDAIFDLQG